MPVIICRGVRWIVFILSHCVSSVWCRSPSEAGGLAHVEPSRQEETGEEVHGGPQCHRRRLTCTSQEGYRHDTAWTTVRMEVKRESSNKNTTLVIIKAVHITSLWVFALVWKMLQLSGIWAGLTVSLAAGVSVRHCGWQTQTDWCSAHFVSCLTVVNQCTVKAWIFPMPVQNAAKKKGIHLPFSPPLALCLALLARGDVHSRRKMQRCFQLKDYFFFFNGDYICCMWWLHQSILIHRDLSGKWKRLGPAESTLLGEQSLKFNSVN